MRQSLGTALTRPTDRRIVLKDAYVATESGDAMGYERVKPEQPASKPSTPPEQAARPELRQTGSQRERLEPRRWNPAEGSPVGLSPERPPGQGTSSPEQAGPTESVSHRAQPLAATYEALKVVQQLNKSSQQPPEQDRPQLHDVLELTSGHGQRLHFGRQEVLLALEGGGDTAEADSPSRLLPAARQLLKGLEGFLADDELWSRLKGAEAATAVLNDRSRLTLREVLDQNLEAILRDMGYREPPPAGQLQTELKTALEELFQDSPDHALRAVNTRRAEMNMAIFTHRLGRVIDEAVHEDMDQGVDRDRERQSLGAQLRSALDAGVRVAAPAVLAAGAVGTLSSSTGLAVQAVGIGAGAIASGRELARQSVQLSATALLNKLLAREASTADSGEQFKGATTRINSALLDYVAGLEDVARDPTPFKLHLAEALGIESLSSVYGLLQAELDHFPSRHRALHVATRDILVLLRDGQNLLQASDRLDGLSGLADRLELQHGRLQRIIANIQA